MPAELDPPHAPAPIDPAPGGVAPGLQVIVDDRLETVLRTRAAGPAGMRVQFRQLADLLGRVGHGAWTLRHEDALHRLDTLFQAIAAAPGGHEGATALLAGTPLANPRLVEHFAGQPPRLALAAIRAARLDAASWLALIPRLPIHARGFLRHRRDLGPEVEALLARLGIDDFALSAPKDTEPAAAVAAPEPANSAKPAVPRPAPAPERAAPDPGDTLAPLLSPAASEGIGAIVRRIEAFRRDREARPGGTTPTSPADHAGHAADPHPRLPFADEPAMAAPRPLGIDLAIDAMGTVVAADADWAPMLVGHRPFTGQPHAPARLDARSTRAFAARAPIDAGIMLIDGAPTVAGAWQIDAVPVFTQASGAFAGYRARLRRPAQATAAATAPDVPPVAQGADRLRQTLHELRTPINAIQGFAEMIQQQVFGATPHQYRSLAASIAADAARMLAGFEDLERLARLETGAADMPTATGGADLAALLARLVAQLDPVIGPREVRLRWQPPAGPVAVAAPAAELEHAMWRLLAVIASTAAPGERLAMALAPANPGGLVRLDLPLPAALAMRDDATLFAADGAKAQGSALGPGGMMGNGFALRLAAAELRAMGGLLQREGARLIVHLPAAGMFGENPEEGALAPAQAG